MFLERRRAGRGAVNLEDDHHSTNKDCKFVLTKQPGNKGLKNKTNYMFVTRRLGPGLRCLFQTRTLAEES